MADPMTPDELYALFDRLGIAHTTFHHPPVFRVDEGQEIKAALPGGHTKNLFLKDAKDQVWLISALGDIRIDLKRLPGVIGSARLSFGREDLLWELLGVRPGSVTLFALVNDTGRRVRLVLDKALFDHALVNFHPLANSATTAVSAEGMMRFLQALGVQPQIVDFSAVGTAGEPAS